VFFFFFFIHRIYRLTTRLQNAARFIRYPTPLIIHIQVLNILLNGVYNVNYETIHFILYLFYFEWLLPTAVELCPVIAS